MTPSELADESTVSVVLHALDDGVTFTDRKGSIVFSNRAADRILGAKSILALPRPDAPHDGVFLADASTPFPAAERPLARALAGEETNGVEMFVRNASAPDGVLLAVTGRPLREPDGTVLGASIVFRDVTVLRAATRELAVATDDLRNAQRRQAELSAFIVHDLKSPLAGILTNAEVIMNRGAVDGEDRDCLADIREAARSMQRMVLDLLDVHLADDGALTPQKNPIRVSELLDDVRAAMAPRAAGKGQRIDVERSEGDPTIVADRQLLQRVLQNLVDNCVKYGPPNGTIRLHAAASDAGHIVLSVRDEGPGVPEALRHRIFDKYAQIERNTPARQHDSRGLGLRFCQVAVDVHGGRIWVDDNVPRGAVFHVELPVAPARSR